LAEASDAVADTARAVDGALAGASPSRIHSRPFQCQRLLIPLTACLQSQMDGVLAQFKNKLGPGGVRHTKLFPIHALMGLGFAQMREHRWLSWRTGTAVRLAQCSITTGGRRVAQQVNVSPASRRAVAGWKKRMSASA
jgi:hypothetical protein